MSGDTGYTEKTKNAPLPIIYKSSVALFWGVAGGTFMHFHFSGQNAQREIEENAKSFKQYMALDDKNSLEAQTLHSQFKSGINPPHTTVQQDIMSVGIGVMISAYCLRKSIKRYLNNARDLANGQATPPQKPHNGLSL